MLELYKRIKSRREELSMSQDELARRMGYKSRSSINKIEKGENDIPQSKIKAFAEALNTTPEYLMGWSSDGIIELKAADEKKLLDGYRALTDFNQQNLMNVMSAFLAQQSMPPPTLTV